VTIVAASGSMQGSMHDKKLYDTMRVITPDAIPRGGDTAYLGTSLTTPYKKPKGKELSDQQKQENRAFSQKRIVVEHAIGRMKNFRILSDRFRNPRRTHSLILKNVAALTNFAAA
jgi:DDE superfamily endonuclease